MAKYTVTFACGHSDVLQLLGPEKDRRWRISQAEQELCPACLEAKRVREAEELRDKAEAAGLPGLTGTERQCVWAEQLREKFTRYAEKERGKLRAERVADYDLAVAYILRTRKRASDWIETRDEGIMISVMHAMEAAKAEASPAPSQEVPEPEDVTAEATLLPEDAAHPGAVEIFAEQTAVRARYPKDDTFRQLVRGKGYRWNADRKVWERKITLFTGSAEDRAAELGNLLLRKGFAVTIYDEAIRARAVSADFVPESVLWVTASTAGRNVGCFCIRWPRGKDFYSAAKRIRGAAWDHDSSEMIVPPESWREVEDFAEVNGFTVSAGAQKLIERERSRVYTTVRPAEPAPPRQRDVLADILASSPDVIADLTDE